MNFEPSTNDKAVIAVLRHRGALNISQLEEVLGVTATAVRQRISRLVASGLVVRSGHNAGRGRPVYQYSLTDAGFRSGGDNLSDLAVVLWQEVNKIADESIRKKVVSGVVERLSEKYRDAIVGETPDERLKSIALLFGEREIPFAAVEENGRVSLQIIGCPYPELSGEDEHICEMETQLISRLADHAVIVGHESCSSGGTCCKFQVAESPGD